MVLYKRNAGKIELYFDSVPSYNIRSTLKTCGWKWQSKRRCWYNFANNETEEFAKGLCEELNPLKENELLNLPKEKLDLTNVIIRKNSLHCDAKHTIIDMAGEVQIYKRNGEVKNYLVPIAYCKDCNLYYILEDTYVEIKKKGIIMCQIMTYNKYKEYGSYDPEDIYWKNESPLKIMGYNVNKVDDLTTNQRRMILERIIENKILTRHKVLSYLDFFVKNHKGFPDAVKKWKEDRIYIEQYELESNPKVAIGKIIVINKS